MKLPTNCSVTCLVHIHFNLGKQMNDFEIITVTQQHLKPFNCAYK